MNENKVKVWLTRDMNGSLYLSQIKTKKENFGWVIENPGYSNNYVKIDANNFLSVKWEDDEPTEAYITLANEPQPKKEIDWEQRRYEIARDIYVRYINADEKGAIRNADKFIEELKKQNK